MRPQVATTETRRRGYQIVRECGVSRLYLYWAFLGVTLEHQLDASVMLSWNLIL